MLMMKIKHLVACISLCTLLNFSNGYTANNTQLTLDDLNGAEISIFDNYNFESQNVHIYTKPTENIAKIKVHKYFGNPNSEEVEINNNNDFFEIKDKDFNKYKEDYDNATYGIAKYNGEYYAVLLHDNMKVNGKTYSKVVCILENDTDSNLSVLQRIPIRQNLDNNDYALKDQFLGKGYNIFLISSLIPYAGIKDGPMVFYPNPNPNFKSAQVNKRIFLENSEDDIITVFNKDGRFAVPRTNLDKSELNSYKKWCDGQVNYGVLKYNSNYYLVEYTKNYNAEDGNTDFNMLPIFFNKEFFKIHYVNSDEYTQYVNKILHVNNNKASENNNNIINNENYIQNENDKNVKDKENISNINENIEEKLNDIMVLKRKLKLELKNDTNNNEKLINEFAKRGLDALYNNIEMRDYIIKGNENETYNNVTQYVRDNFQINLSLAALKLLKQYLTNREYVDRIMSNY